MFFSQMLEMLAVLLKRNYVLYCDEMAKKLLESIGS